MKKFLSKFSNVRKLVAAVVGVVAIIAAPFVPGVTESSIFGLSQDLVVQAILGLMTAIGVYQLSNEQPAE